MQYTGVQETKINTKFTDTQQSHVASQMCLKFSVDVQCKCYDL